MPTVQDLPAGSGTTEFQKLLSFATGSNSNESGFFDSLARGMVSNLSEEDAARINAGEAKGFEQIYKVASGISGFADPVISAIPGSDNFNAKGISGISTAEFSQKVVTAAAMAFVDPVKAAQLFVEIAGDVKEYVDALEFQEASFQAIRQNYPVLTFAGTDGSTEFGLAGFWNNNATARVFGERILKGLKEIPGFVDLVNYCLFGLVEVGDIFYLNNSGNVDTYIWSGFWNNVPISNLANDSVRHFCGGDAFGDPNYWIVSVTNSGGLLAGFFGNIPVGSSGYKIQGTGEAWMSYYDLVATNTYLTQSEAQQAIATANWNPLQLPFDVMPETPGINRPITFQQVVELRNRAVNQIMDDWEAGNREKVGQLVTSALAWKNSGYSRDLVGMTPAEAEKWLQNQFSGANEKEILTRRLKTFLLICAVLIFGFLLFRIFAKKKA